MLNAQNPASLNILLRSSCNILPSVAYTLPAAIMNKLNTSFPTIVPNPKFEHVIKSEMKVHNNFDADAPAAINVAPATSSGMSYRFAILSMDGTSRVSVTILRVQSDSDAMVMCRMHCIVDDGSWGNVEVIY